MDNSDGPNVSFSQLQAQLALSPTDALTSDYLCVAYDGSVVSEHTG